MMAFLISSSFLMVLILYMIHGYHSLIPHSLNRKLSASWFSPRGSEISSTAIKDMTGTVVETLDNLSVEKLSWNPSGYKTWIWQNHRINYIDLGGDSRKPPLLLVHGFGASVFHWRYNIPALSKKFHVFAIDLLGFGLSDKPLISYSVDIWRDQILDFISEVIRKSTDLPVTVAGNSLGGFSALYAASADRATTEELINGCILLNAAGRFKPEDSAVTEKKNTSPFISRLASLAQRLVIWLSFMYTKQPARIAQILKTVYPVDSSNVDDELVESIRVPSLHPDAGEVFYRIISNTSFGAREYLDDLLARLKVPLMLLWGMKDPWIRPNAAEKIQRLVPSAKLVEVDAGHCPHDEKPIVVNQAIEEFVLSITNVN